jgi:carboxyl-terminal processing protease
MNIETPKNNKINIWLPFLLAVMMLGGMIVGGKLQPTGQETRIVFENVDTESKSIGQGRVEELIRYIQAKYVDTINTEHLVETAITSLFKDLDPHSVYMSSEQVKKANDALEGSFVGIGIEYFLKEDTVIILNVLEGGPAEEAGLQFGDRIVDVENLDEESDDNDNDEDISLVKKLRGADRSKIELSIIRRNEPKLLKKEVSRGRIVVNSIDTHYMLNDDTGYIKLNKFSANTITEFMDALSDLVDNHKMQNLVFDLRYNGGGYLHEAVKILNQIFQEKDQMLVYTVGKNVKKEEFFSTGRNVFDIKKVFVLIDENSASASEIVAGAIQDWDRGVIIGRRSYGKGLVQEQYDLKDGSALRLTVARYYTPAGRLIQRDYTEKEEYDQYLEKRIQSGEFTNSDQITILDTSKFYTANGRQVYAGGGITPDVYVPFDSLLLDSNYQKLSGSLTEFAFQYTERNPMNLSDDEFIDNFELDEFILQDLLVFHEKLKNDKIELSELNDKISREILTTLKAKIARQWYGNLPYYKILHNADPVIREALNTQKSYNQLTEKSN